MLDRFNQGSSISPPSLWKLYLSPPAVHVPVLFIWPQMSIHFHQNYILPPPWRWYLRVIAKIYSLRILLGFIFAPIVFYFFFTFSSFLSSRFSHFSPKLRRLIFPPGVNIFQYMHPMTFIVAPLYMVLILTANSPVISTLSTFFFHSFEGGLYFGTKPQWCFSPPYAECKLFCDVLFCIYLSLICTYFTFLHWLFVSHFPSFPIPCSYFLPTWHRLMSSPSRGMVAVLFFQNIDTCIFCFFLVRLS